MRSRGSGFSPRLPQTASIAPQKQTSQLLAQFDAALGRLLGSGNVRPCLCIDLHFRKRPIEDTLRIQLAHAVEMA